MDAVRRPGLPVHRERGRGRDGGPGGVQEGGRERPAQRQGHRCLRPEGRPHRLQAVHLRRGVWCDGAVQGLQALRGLGPVQGRPQAHDEGGGGRRHAKVEVALRARQPLPYAGHRVPHLPHRRRSGGARQASAAAQKQGDGQGRRRRRGGGDAQGYGPAHLVHRQPAREDSRGRGRGGERQRAACPVRAAVSAPAPLADCRLSRESESSTEDCSARECWLCGMRSRGNSRVHRWSCRIHV
mmetsp:Transcript_32971/g.106615  ORF Transcript_32971/g.106615 Transcript_32971/m.106615 type:complete len:240 (+) Transcript_32971:1003-1722(+)